MGLGALAVLTPARVCLADAQLARTGCRWRRCWPRLHFCYGHIVTVAKELTQTLAPRRFFVIETNR